jgi:hypothetical protein
MNNDNYLLSNKTAAAELRDAERDLVAHAGPAPVNLRSVPRERWTEYEDWQLTLPDGVQKFLDGHDGTPLTRELVHSLEEAVENHHGITAPWHVSMTLALQAGRAWTYLPEAAPYLTGFVLGKDE